MSDIQELQIRLGFGLRPGAAGPRDLAAFDQDILRVGARKPFITTAYAIGLQRDYQTSKRSQASTDAIHGARWDGVKDHLTAPLISQVGFGDRMKMFWADHFSARPAGTDTFPLYIAYLNEAIQGNIHRTFYEMLLSVVTHPSMMIFLDQHNATGPNSPFQKKKKTANPASENLAREILELHTMGSTGPYTQADVTQLAHLLSGLRYAASTGPVFNAHYAEPGPKRILGKVYNPKSETPSLDHIKSFLSDLALRPATRNYVCRSMAIHFVAQNPAAPLVNAMIAEWNKTKGNLPAVYKVMIRHATVIQRKGSKVKRPIEFTISALRAVSAKDDVIKVLKPWQVADFFVKPMGLMGQDILAVPGPNGWPEEDAAWINPGAYAARIEWSYRILERIVGAKNLPDPANLATRALGKRASAALVQSVPRAPSKREAATVLVASNDFNRR